jgi:hypothetical protein
MTCAARHAGGVGSWGIADAYDDATTVRPTVFLREALDQAIAGIRAIMTTRLLAVTVIEPADEFDPTSWIPEAQVSDALLLLTGVRPGGDFGHDTRVA